MKFLPQTIFERGVPRVTQKFYEWYLSFRRKPQVYRMSSSEVTEGKYYFVMKSLGGSK
jgi:hypothetical protein